MPGHLRGTGVVVDEQSEATRHYNKGYFGRMEGATMHLDLIEAAFLVESERMEVLRDGQPMSLQELMLHGIRQDPAFEIRYLVYRDLRQRGYVADTSEQAMNLYPRGGAPHSHEPDFLVKALSERSPFSIKSIAMLLHALQRRRLMVGIVDEEGDLTYYYIKFFRMQGTMEERDSYQGIITLLGDRSMVWDVALADELQEQYVGREFGDHAVQLSLMETAYLAEKGATVHRNGEELSRELFMAHAREIQPDIERRLLAYKSLRGKGLIPKTGFKFGSHFRVYRRPIGEGHAPYLVHMLPEDFTSTWTEVSRAVRLANSVRKEMVFARAGDGIEYIRLKRITP
ncbi:MAG: tRNA-intron lyase [Thermoplasmatota archaeon]